MTDSLVRYIQDCEAGDLEAWRRLSRYLKRMNMSGEFSSLIFSHVQERVSNLAQESRKDHAERCYKPILGYRLHAISNRCFHVFPRIEENLRGQWSPNELRHAICGAAVWTEEMKYADFSATPMCRLCFRSLARTNVDTDPIKDFHERYGFWDPGR